LEIQGFAKRKGRKRTGTGAYRRRKGTADAELEQPAAAQPKKNQVQVEDEGNATREADRGDVAVAWDGRSPSGPPSKMNGTDQKRPKRWPYTGNRRTSPGNQTGPTKSTPCKPKGEPREVQQTPPKPATRQCRKKQTIQSDTRRQGIGRHSAKASGGHALVERYKFTYNGDEDAGLCIICALDRC